MRGKIAVLPGDGIGPEVIREATGVLKAVEERFGHEFSLTYGEIGAAAIASTGDPFPENTEEICRSSNAILFGAIGAPEYDNNPEARVRPEEGLLRMRKSLGLYANIRPVTTYEDLISLSPLKEERIRNVDFVVYRELTGGIYFGKPSFVAEDHSEAVDTCSYNRNEIVRIATLAFEAARKRSSKLTLVDKANVLATSQLWRKTVQELAAGYPKIELEFMFVDNAAMQIILNPAQFDVILTENMFGDIITDEASVITGSIGLMPSASVGETVSLFEPIHGSYPQEAGKNSANPMASVLSLAMLLEHSFGLAEEGRTVREAVAEVIARGIVTEDLNPTKFFTTTKVGSAISDIILSKSLAE